ncbi:MAG: DNA starvation/stationary phase protection protein [Symploca sp. SIO2G7]|nr:DNA starvation/stationary phase protection protein [Symploca sp. SIO2G7]
MITTIETNLQANQTSNISIEQQKYQALAEALSRFLADTYTLYLRTQNFHWNVTGSRFYSLHELFEKHYQEMAHDIDTIAERIRSIGFPAPGSYTKFMSLTSIPEAEEVASAEEMILLLVKGNEAVNRSAASALQQAEVVGDVPTADLLTRRMAVHQKNVWMLRSLLQD